MAQSLRTRSRFICILCLDDLQPASDEDHIIATPCSHVYHRNCLRKFIADYPSASSAPDGKIRGSCPNCYSIIGMDDCHQIFPRTMAVSDAIREHYEEDQRVLQKLADVQAELKETNKRFDQLRDRYCSAMAEERESSNRTKVPSGSSVGVGVANRVMSQLTPSPAAAVKILGGNAGETQAQAYRNAPSSTITSTSNEITTQLQQVNLTSTRPGSGASGSAKPMRR